jgi:hypothetical protein
LGCGFVANSFGNFGSIFNWKFWAMAFLKDSEWIDFYVSCHTNFGGYGFGGKFFCEICFIVTGNFELLASLEILNFLAKVL